MLSAILAGVGLAFVQFLAALPWLAALDPPGFAARVRKPGVIGGVLAGVLGAGVALGLFTLFLRDPSRIEFAGRLYGGLLHIQLAVDFFVLAFALLLAVWPKGAAVALAAFREGLRQPMFWLLTVAALSLLAVSVVVPYFTFGDDYKMMKQLGFDIIMLSAALFGVIAASISVNEEIEGRTAVTLMSKPVTRRQFLLGKFVGILLACWAMTLLVGWFFNWALLVQPGLPGNQLDEVNDTMPKEVQAFLLPKLAGLATSPIPAAVVKGAGIWFSDSIAHTLGMVLGFGQVMVLLALAASLATRLPFVANLVLCLVIFLLGHLAPVLVQVSEVLKAKAGGGGADLIGFLARLFDTLLPALEFFSIGPAIIRDNPIPIADFARYVGGVFGYSLLYTAIALLFGLILFEDRDLA